MSHEVFVIYYKGQPYDKASRKIVYLTKGAAQGVITSEAKEIAESECLDYWWDLTKVQKGKRIEEVKKEFKIIKYTPEGT